MSLPDICIRRPVFASMMSLALVLVGLVSLFRLPVRELPDIDPPIVNVLTVYPGANATVVETEVTERLEDVINGVEGIKKLTSESREELSSITVEFTLARDIDLAAQDVRDRVSRVRGILPDDIDDPIISKQDSDARPMMWVSMFSERYSTLELTTLADRYLKEPLQTVRGVSSVLFGGEKRFAIRIRLDSKKMAAHGVTVLDIQRALQEQNVELPSGRVEGLERELTIETLGELKTPEEFNQLVVRRDGDILVRLRDVGLAEIGVEDERSIARYNSKPAVGLGIVKQAKANTIEVAQGIKDELARVTPTLPEGIDTFVAYDESIFVEDSIEQVWETLFIAFILVAGTIYVFLADGRSTIIPVLTIPVSAIATFAVLAVMGYSVNILTMLGLVLAIGVVVDDSIVVLENIYRHVEEGQSPMQAAFTGMKEITFAVIATTAALVAVFLPLAFQTTITGRLFVEFAVSLSGAVIISSFVALTLTPMACSRLLQAKREGASGGFQWFETMYAKLSGRYAALLDRALQHRRLVLGGALASLVLTVGFYFLLDREFLPTEDKGRLFCLAIAPEGSTAEYTDRQVAKMEQIISEQPEAAGYFSATALSRGGPGKASEGLMFVRFKQDRDRSVGDVIAGPKGVGARFFMEIPGAFAIGIMPKAIGGGFGQSFQLVLQAQDLEQLSAVTDTVVGKLRESGMLQGVRSTFLLNKPELEVRIDRDRAAVLGVSIDDISRTLQILFGGRDLSKVKKDGEEYDVVVQLTRESRLSPSDLDHVYVRSSRDRLIPLSNVIHHEPTAGPNAVFRHNRLRSATIEGTPQGIPMGEIIDRTEAMLAETLPAGFRYEWSGEAEDLKEAGSSAVFVVILAVLIVYMVLASQFESLVHPLTVMLALPLGALGAFAGLWILSLIDALGNMFYGWAHYAPDPPWIAHIFSFLIPRIPAMNVNLFSQIGMVLLFGLVTKNSILLVDFANQAVDRGASALEAMREAGRIRFRPIAMTAFATVAGILPIAIGFGAGAESRRPMGVAIVAGMVVSTILTLVVVPVFYVTIAELFERRKEASS